MGTWRSMRFRLTIWSGCGAPLRARVVRGTPSLRKHPPPALAVRQHPSPQGARARASHFRCPGGSTQVLSAGGGVFLRWWADDTSTKVNNAV